MTKSTPRPNPGFGLGLRKEHYQSILSDHPAVDWFEVLTENYLVDGGMPLHYLDRIRADYPVAMHGVSMSIGSSDPLDFNYLQRVRALASRIEPMWISDHLCWTGVDGSNLHDLMPLPYTEEALSHLVDRIESVQDFLGRRILLENVSSYVAYGASAMTEWEFLVEVARRADCLVLLDVNNVYVSAFNHHFEPREYIDAIPPERVWQVHLAGHRNLKTHIVDTHDEPVIDAVWDLFGYAWQHLGPVASMIERDDNIPPIQDLMTELDHMRALAMDSVEAVVP